MARNQSALNALLDALRAGGDLDVVRQALALVLQALIDAAVLIEAHDEWQVAERRYLSEARSPS